MGQNRPPPATHTMKISKQMRELDLNRSRKCIANILNIMIPFKIFIFNLYVCV